MAIDITQSLFICSNNQLPCRFLINNFTMWPTMNEKLNMISLTKIYSFASDWKPSKFNQFNNEPLLTIAM